MQGCLESGGLMTGRHIVPNSRYSYLTIDYVHALTQTWDFIIIFLMRGWILTHVSRALAPYQQIFYLPQMLQKAVKESSLLLLKTRQIGAVLKSKQSGRMQREEPQQDTPGLRCGDPARCQHTHGKKRADSQLFKETTKTWGIKAAGRSDEGINFFLCKQQGRYIIFPCSFLTVLAQLCSTRYSADVVRKTSGGPQD